MQTDCTILIIDDQPRVLESMADFLTDKGYRTLRAQNGREGLDMFASQRPDLILMDLFMPGIDGPAVLRGIHETDPDQPIIVVSDQARITNAIEALRMGAWDYILRPIEDMSVIQHTVRRAIERAHLLAQNRAYQKNLEELVRRRTAALERANAHLTGINDRLQKVVATTRGLSMCADVARFGARLLGQFADHMLASGGSLFLLEPEGLRLLHTLDPDHVPEFIPFPLHAQSVMNRVIQSRRAMLITDITMEKRLIKSGWEGYTNGSALVFPLEDENGQVIGVLTLHSKISPPFLEQDKEIGAILASYSCETLRAARSMEALRESEARFRELAEMLPEAVFETDLEMRLTFANHKAAERFGYTGDDLSDGFNAKTFFIPEERWRLPDARTDRAVGAVQYTGLRKDSSTFPLLFHMAPIQRGDQTVGYRGVVVDITEELALKDHLRQAQKIEAVGQLAGGIAHDLNNLLSPILGFGEMLLEDMDDEDEHRASVEEIMHAGSRARDLVHKLLAFSRKQTLAVKPVNINTILSGFERLLRRTIREDIDIDFVTAPALPACMADVGQIEQVIVNLAINAADAMPDGGKLVFTTDIERIDGTPPGDDPEMEPGEYVVLAVNDTGHGMDEETCRKIFEPFFSTKGARGTGLGLSTVYGIVKQHGGGIRVASQPGRGTTFTIHLPAASHAAVVEKHLPRARSDPKGMETILLVEDNAQVRKMTRILLERRGYTIIAAQDGREALSALAAHKGQIHLMLTDVVLTGMNGRELYTQAAKTDPDLKVLYMSGYSDDIIAHHGVLEEGVDFIEKPFSNRDLIEKVRQVLQASEK